MEVDDEHYERPRRRRLLGRSSVSPPTSLSTVKAQDSADRPDPSRWRVLTVVSAAQFLAILDLFAVTIAFPAVAHDFRPASLPDVSWILNAYTILLAALLVPAGRFADDTGRRRCFLVGLALFGLSSIGCAAAPDLAVLIAARALQGIGAAVIVPTSLALALPAFPQSEKATAVGIWAAVGAVASGVGPTVGGVLVMTSWRWIFLINVPVVLAALIAGHRVLPPAMGGQHRRLDLVGTVLILTATGCLTTVFLQASTWGYVSLSTGATLAIAVVCTGACVVHFRQHPDPLISPELFRVRTFTVGVVGIFVYYLGFAAMLLGAALFLTGEWHYSVLAAGLGISPGPIAAAVVSSASGRIVRYLGTRSTAVLGGLVFALGCAWWLATSHHTPAYWLSFMPGVTLIGIGNALIQPALFGTVATLPSRLGATGAAILTMARQLGSALGVALLVAILNASQHPGIATYRHAWIFMIGTGLLASATSLTYRHRVSQSEDVSNRVRLGVARETQ
ncbi:MAG: MFS transporter [Pseudonocardiaceae bacterium]